MVVKEAKDDGTVEIESSYSRKTKIVPRRMLQPRIHLP